MAVSASGSSFNTFQILHHLQEFALMMMKPVNSRFWPFIGFSAKAGGIEKVAILNETETMKQAKEWMNLLLTEVENAKK